MSLAIVAQTGRQQNEEIETVPVRHYGPYPDPLGGRTILSGR
jgi:hypothetical protein